MSMAVYSALAAMVIQSKAGINEFSSSTAIWKSESQLNALIFAAMTSEHDVQLA
jgi:hypothetical protein